MIFITGCARSGTSMVAGIVARCGAFGGKLCGSTRWNPSGQYENEEIRNSVIKPILRMIGADPMGQNPLPDINKLMEMTNGFPAETRDTVMKIIRAHGYKNGIPWFFKGAKICLIWPIWMEAFPEAQYIIARRPDELIIQSCIRTSFMRKRSTVAEWQAWIDFHKVQFLRMAVKSPEKVDVVSTLDIVNGNFEGIKKIVEKCGLVWDQKKVEKFIDKRIWNTVK